jgi:hypothetical protein
MRKLVILFCIFNCYAIFGQEEKPKVEVININMLCLYDGAPLMWMKKTTSIHKKRNKESEVVGKAHIESEICILSKKFEKEGWLYICCEGIDGWIYKASLLNMPPKEE